MIYNNYPDDYIVINAKWVEWDNDNECWCFMTEDAFEKAQSLADYTKQVRKEVVQEIRKTLFEYLKVNSMEELENLSLLDSTLTYDVITDKLDQLQGETK